MVKHFFFRWETISTEKRSQWKSTCSKSDKKNIEKTCGCGVGAKRIKTLQHKKDLSSYNNYHETKKLTMYSSK